MDENQFFEEFSLRICGSLEIDKALWKSFLFVRKVLPADQLILTIYNRAIGALEVVATADERGGNLRADKVIITPPSLRKSLDEFMNYPHVRISNGLSECPLHAAVSRHCGWPEYSSLVARLVIENNFVGSLILHAQGKGRYTEEHARYWSRVTKPAGIALSNSRHSRELLQLRNLLTVKNKSPRAEERGNVGNCVVGEDSGLRKVMEKVIKVSSLSSPVLITGETGTGKEVIANAIHNLSPRKNGPLVKLNCGAIPDSLIDSELFGHERGAFTGALTRKLGRFERAHRGTIFLDEIGELPHHAQVRLLRVLQEKEIERIGSTQPVKVDIRVISATHQNLRELVERGFFREDLYYRLNVFPIHINPLRERKGDIPALVDHFIRRKIREMGLRFTPTLESGAIDRLMEYHWPGNVRELENVVERAIIHSSGRPLSFNDIGLVTPRTVQKVQGPGTHAMRLEDVEAGHISRVIEITRGKIEGQKGAAEMLGMNPSTLRHRMRKLGIPFGRMIQDSGPMSMSR